MRPRDESYIDEPYLIRQYCLEFSKQITHIFADLGAWRAGDPKRIVDKLGPDLDGYIKLNSHKHGRKQNYVHLRDFYYNPKDSEMIYGKRRILRNEAKDNGDTKTIDHSQFSQDTVDHYVVQIKRRELESHEFNQEYHAEITSKTSLKGSYGGAEIEQELQATFGTSIEVNTSGENEKETLETYDREIPIKAGVKVLVIDEDTVLETEIPFTIDGYLDFKLHLNFENWSQGGRNGTLVWNKREGHNHLDFDSLYGFLRFLNGYDPKYPRMELYHARCSDKASDAWDWMENKSNRLIQVDGVKRRTFEDNANYRLEEVVG